MLLFCYNQRAEYYLVLNIIQLNIVKSDEYYPVIFPACINWILLHHCDINYCNAIYLNQGSLFNLASTFKVVNFMSKSSNFIGLLIVHNGAHDDFGKNIMTTAKKKNSVKKICYSGYSYHNWSEKFFECI